MNTSFALLVIAIAATGYYVATQCYAFKYEVARQSGHRLYLTTVTIGFVVMIAAKSLLYVFSVTSVLALAIITAIIGFTFTWRYNKRPNAKELALIKAWSKNDFDNLVAHCLTTYKPLMLTLDTRKVYVGFIATSVEPNPENSHLSILPVYSGYREEVSLHMKLTHRYEEIMNFLVSDDPQKEGDINDYLITIPTEHIVSASVFNPNLYRAIDGDKDQILVT